MMKMNSITRIASLLITALMLFSLCACGGSGSSTKDEEGKLNKITTDGGNVIGYDRKYFNDNGDISRLDVYDKDENYDHYILYEYDEQNRLVKETTYRADGIGQHYYTYVYNDKGVMTEKGYYTMMNGATRTLYDDKGYAIERYSYNNDNKLAKHEVIENGVWKDAPLEEPTEASTDAKH